MLREDHIMGGRINKIQKFLFVPNKALENQYSHCEGCGHYPVCSELENKVIDLINRLGLDEKIDNPYNVANIINYYESQGVNCETLKKKFKEVKKEFQMINPISDEKKMICSYVEITDKLKAAEK